jgi:hypothetical protein
MKCSWALKGGLCQLECQEASRAKHTPISSPYSKLFIELCWAHTQNYSLSYAGRLFLGDTKKVQWPPERPHQRNSYEDLMLYIKSNLISRDHILWCLSTQDTIGYFRWLLGASAIANFQRLVGPFSGASLVAPIRLVRWFPEPLGWLHHIIFEVKFDISFYFH